MQTIDDLYAALARARDGGGLVLVPALFESPAALALVSGRPGHRLPLADVRLAGPPETPGAVSVEGRMTEGWPIPGGDGVMEAIDLTLHFAAAAEGPPSVAGTARGRLRLGGTEAGVEGTLAADGSLLLGTAAGALPAAT